MTAIYAPADLQDCDGCGQLSDLYYNEANGLAYCDTCLSNEVAPADVTLGLTSEDLMRLASALLTRATEQLMMPADESLTTDSIHEFIRETLTEILGEA